MHDQTLFAFCFFIVKKKIIDSTIVGCYQIIALSVFFQAPYNPTYLCRSQTEAGAFFTFEVDGAPPTPLAPGHLPSLLLPPEMEITKNKNSQARLQVFYRSLIHARVWFSFWKSQTFGKSLKTYGSGMFFLIFLKSIGWYGFSYGFLVVLE